MFQRIGGSRIFKKKERGERKRTPFGWALLGGFQEPVLGPYVRDHGGGAPGRSRVLAIQNLQVIRLERWKHTLSSNDYFTNGCLWKPLLPLWMG